MDNLIKAEFRKIVSTKTWWALLIPTAGMAFFVSLGVGAGAGAMGSFLRVPSAYLALNLSFAFTTIFASIFGALGLAAEMRHRTITTTYLTGSRGGVFAAKLLVNGIFGLGYGVVSIIFVTLGTVSSGAPNALPSAGSWLLVCLVNIVVVGLWTVLGVGLAGLISQQVAVVLILPIYLGLGENLLSGFLHGLHIGGVGGFLPGNTSSGAVLGFALQLTGGQSSDAGLSSGTLSQWWASALVFVAWTALFCVIGWAVGNRRDIT